MGFLRGVFFGIFGCHLREYLRVELRGVVGGTGEEGWILKYFRAEFKADKRLYFKVVYSRYNCIKL